jgi:hypothetical protein
MQKHCRYCGRFFVPDPRSAGRQKTCGRKKCRKQHEKTYAWRWRKENPCYFTGRYSKTKDCLSRAPDARKKYLSQQHVRHKNTERMAQYRARKMVENSNDVMCTNCDIEVKGPPGQECKQSGVKIRVMRTKGDIQIFLAATESGSSSTEQLHVMCTKADRCL